MNVTARLLDKVTPDNSRVRVSLSKQRAYLLLGDEIVIDTPISSGKRVAHDSERQLSCAGKR